MSDKVNMYDEWNAPRTIPGLLYAKCGECGTQFSTIHTSQTECDFCIRLTPLRLKIQNLEDELSLVKDEVYELKTMARDKEAEDRIRKLINE